MIEVRENLALVAKSADDEIGVHSSADQLNGHLLLEMRIRAYGPVNDTHAALANAADQAVTADDGAE